MPADQRRSLDIALLRAIIVEIAKLARHGEGLQLQRLAGHDIDRAADRTFVDARFGRLVDIDPADQLRREQRIVEGAARRVEDEPVGRRHGLAVQQGAVERRIGAQDRYLFALAELAVDGDARHQRQRFGDIGIGEFADIFRGNAVDDRVGVTLDVDRLGERGAITGDDDISGICIGVRRGSIASLRMRGTRKQRNGAGGTDQKSPNPHISPLIYI